MRVKPTALAYLDLEVSGRALEWDVAQCRRLARRLGYSMIWVPEFTVLGLVDLVRGTDVDAVLVPSPEHVSPALVALLADTVDVESVLPRRSIVQQAVRFA
ncbi:hypothetical protein [Nocardia sp. NPDC127526]|uniref:hypothetical protein n=1 Tax=Nocardia sp. NPDC127526 TaxID=3345393 RepID=UPI003644D828